MMMQRFVLAPEALEIGLVSRVVPRDELLHEALATARHLAQGDAFHLEMMKAACNGAQDAPGLTAGVRGALPHWAAYRASADDNGSVAVRGAPGTGVYSSVDGEA